MSDATGLRGFRNRTFFYVCRSARPLVYVLISNRTCDRVSCARVARYIHPDKCKIKMLKRRFSFCLRLGAMGLGRSMLYIASRGQRRPPSPVLTGPGRERVATFAQPQRVCTSVYRHKPLRLYFVQETAPCVHILLRLRGDRSRHKINYICYISYIRVIEKSRPAFSRTEKVTRLPR